MFTNNEKEWILEAINHLKRRKARPDFGRISLRMKRKHQLTITQTRQLLDSLVESGIVVKAVYKNNTSYRDVSKWKKGKLGGQILNSSRMLQRFVKAITTKQQSSKDGKCTGVSAKDIEEWISDEKEDKCFLSGAALRDAIENEVINGYLKKVEINNESLYSVNTEKVDVNSKLEGLGLELESDISEKRHTGGFENINSISSDSSQQEDGLNDLSVLILAINETEESKGIGSTLMNIEHWIKGNLPDSSFNDNRSLMMEFIKEQVKAGFIRESTNDNVSLYSVIDKAFDKNSSSLRNISIIGGSVEGVEQSTRNGMKGIDLLFNDLSSKQSGKMSSIALRPPSKRKRIMKDHGPDFEIELPTKSKSKNVNGSMKEYSFPTPLDSPISEKSETTIEQKFKFDQRTKKRGRPKKTSPERNGMEDDFDNLDENKSKRDGPSEQSSMCQEDNDDDRVSEVALPDAHDWTSQQVADYFLGQGYEEESKQMLENDLDGAALGLLRRSDIVGPPAGGILKIKKLGVALKLFRDIRNLLYQGNVDNYVDPYEERAFFRS